MNIDKINISKISWDKELTNSRLEFNIKGTNISNVIVNTLRRVSITNVPIYAFTNINITVNTSVFNNNYLKLRLNNLPVIGLKSNNHIFKKEMKDKISEEKINILNMDDINLNVNNNDINISTLDKLTMYLEYENTSDKIESIGTNNCKFYLKEKLIESPYPINIQLIKLQPKQKIKLSAITELGIEEESSIYSPLSIFAFKHNSDTDYDLILESRGQLTETEILEMSNTNIQSQLDNIIELIPDEKSLEGKLILKDMDHTLGNIITSGLQLHSNIDFAGYNMPHPLDNKIVIHFKLNKGNFKNILIEVLKFYKTLFSKINEKILLL